MVWSTAFRSTFRLFRDQSRPSENVDVLLASAGRTGNEILPDLTYDQARALVPGVVPNGKRYRDARQLFRTVGLLYEEPINGTLVVTELGRAVERWRPVINKRNCLVLGRHAAQALGACQLRNPTREGRSYDADVEVFPFSFIWRAMLALDFRISSDELNRAIFKTRNEQELLSAIDCIRSARLAGDINILGNETITEKSKNDRILVWMSWASFGWSLIADKRTSASGDYEIPSANRLTLQNAAAIRHRHRSFASEASYVEYLSNCAGLPKDLR